MDYKTHNDNPNIDINGTSFQDYLDKSYDELVEKFGEPIRNSGWEKVTCEWEIKFEDGTVATIYNWKTQEEPTEERDWHIGGHDSTVVFLIKSVV